jgi:Do/DeqQ family serine protease
MIHLTIGAAAFGLLLAAGEVNGATQVPQSLPQMALSFAPLVKQTTPAVVNVYARTKIRSRRASPFADDPFFRHFFGGDGLGAPRERFKNSLGSGVIVDNEGLVVTNNHVVGGASDIRVVLSDKREFDATILLSDDRTDLAVLKIDGGAAGLPSLELGDSDALEVGDLVLAIGNPFGVGQTVTSGIVSALARTEVGVSDYQFFIQTDAAINPGNSGGALIDVRGRLIGINTAIYSRTGGSIGIGFAIPANMVNVVVKSAREGNRVVRPWLGADLQDVTSEIADALGLQRPSGSLVAAVAPQSPLASAGLTRGDVIIAMDDREVSSAKEFVYRIATKTIGSKVTVNYLRTGRERAAAVMLIAAPETPPRSETRLGGNNPFGGLVVVNLSPAVTEELGLAAGLSGVVVERLEDGPAQRVGFRPGDIIAVVNGDEIDAVGKLSNMIFEGADSWFITVNRKGRVIRLQLEN